jgi:YVTN family beta-propeller protein
MTLKKKVILGFIATGALAGGQLALSQPALLVLEKTTQTLAIIDPASLKVLARAPAGPDPHEVVASSDGTRAYISNYGGEGSSLNTLSVVDLSARQSLPPVSLGALRSPHGLDSAGGKVYFTAESAKAIGRYDPRTGTIDWVLGTGQDGTHMIQVAPDLQRIFTSNVRSGTISLIEADEVKLAPVTPPGSKSPMPGPPVTRLRWEATAVAAGLGCEGFDVSPNGQYLWAANAGDATVTVIDVPTKHALATIPIPLKRANRLKFTLDGQYVLISGLGTFPADSSTTHFVVLDARTHKLVKELDLGGGAAGILLDPDRSRAFVAVSRGNKVAVIDLSKLEVTAQIAPLGEPDGMAWAASAK